MHAIDYHMTRARQQLHVCDTYSPSLLFQAQIGFDHLLSAGLSLTTLRWLIVCHSRHSDRLGSVLADFSVIVVIQIDHTQLLHPCTSVSRPWPMDQKTHPTGRKAGYLHSLPRHRVFY